MACDLLRSDGMHHRLSTGALVYGTVYSLMKSEEARLRTFSSWPRKSPSRPSDLAEAGFFYLPVYRGDCVQCFYCEVKLSGWEPEDNPWEKHGKENPNCLFICGHDVGNVPLPKGMESFEERLRSFTGLQLPVDHQSLARAGFYSTGTGDEVRCFRCNEDLRGWLPGTDPWEEHAKHYPGCSFLLEEKGVEFINSIQLRGPRSRISALF